MSIARLPPAAGSPDKFWTLGRPNGQSGSKVSREVCGNHDGEAPFSIGRCVEKAHGSEASRELSATSGATHPRRTQARRHVAGVRRLPLRRAVRNRCATRGCPGPPPTRSTGECRSGPSQGGMRGQPPVTPGDTAKGRPDRGEDAYALAGSAAPVPGFRFVNFRREVPFGSTPGYADTDTHRSMPITAVNCSCHRWGTRTAVMTVSNKRTLTGVASVVTDVGQLIPLSLKWLRCRGGVNLRRG